MALLKSLTIHRLLSKKHNVVVREKWKKVRNGSLSVTQLPVSISFLTFVSDVPLSFPGKANVLLPTNNLRCCDQRTFSTSRGFSLSSRKIWEVPSHEEVLLKKGIYKEPKSLVKQLLNPLIKSGDTVEPVVIFTPKLNGHLWRARLELHWPQRVTFTGVHGSLHQAEENAYILACDLYKFLGLIYDNCGKMINIDEDNVFLTLETLYEKGTHTGINTGSPYNFQLSTTKTKEDGMSVWQSELQVPWPYSFSVISSASSLQSAQYMSCLLTYMRLKFLGLLNGKNNLALDKIPKIRKYVSTSEKPPMTRADFSPHFEIYVDASKSGFGAYLLTKDDGKINWICEPWPKHFPDDVDSNGKFNTTFFEYYALVSACYTWKHKFVNKKVLCWSDNMSAVNFTNQGPNCCVKSQVQMYGKLYMIMIQMCAKYNINLKAMHVRRIENHAADLLSKLNVNQFKKFVPEAKGKSKKTKKLLFWNPLVENDKPNPDS